MKNVTKRGRAAQALLWVCAALAACSGEEDVDPNAPVIAAEDPSKGGSLETAQSKADRTAPILTVQSPTALPGFATLSPTIKLAGLVQDNQKVLLVTWTAPRSVGVATHSGSDTQANWQTGDVTLAKGDNLVTVRAYDRSGNRAVHKLMVRHDPNPPTVTEATGTWKLVAREGYAFTVEGQQRVRYGLNGAWVERSIQQLGECTNTYFGSDPVPNTTKVCQVLTGSANVSAPAGTSTGAGAPTEPAPAPTATPGGSSGTTSGTAAPTATTTASTPQVDPGANDASMDAPRTQLPTWPLAAEPVALAPGELRWSDANTWGGAVPGAGAEVVVPAGKTVVLDSQTASLGALRIEGTLRFAPMDVALTAQSIRVTGALLAGEATRPYQHRATITLTGSPTATNDGVARGLVVQGGRLELYGVLPQPVWTRLNDHAAAGTRSLTLASTVNWRQGDILAVAPSDYFGVAETQRVLLNTVSGKTLQLGDALSAARWGKLQYVTANGMSLTPDASYAPPVAPAPTILDERASVANLSRNIVIQGADDTVWANQGFGAHVMVMDLRSKAVVDGVEFRRVGQAGHLGRYPFHWHMLSYVNGQMVGDAVGHSIRNSSVWNSAQRCIVVHGTNGVQVTNNVCHDIKGHAFFLEDAVERRNVFEGNIALKVRNPLESRRMQVHEGDVFQGGSSGFWLTNPDNVVRNNLAADADGTGFWLAYPRKPLGLSASVPMMPDRLKLGEFAHNVAHSNRKPGVLLEWVPADAAGNVIPNYYIPTVDGSENNWQNQVPFELKRVTSYKNMDGAYRNRASRPVYSEWVSADNVGTHMAGGVMDGEVLRGLFVGYSLNNLTPYPNIWPYQKPTAFATYHSTLAMRDNTVVNFPFSEGESSGAWRVDDYYTMAVDKGLVRNTNNRLIATHAGYRVLPPNMDGKPLENRHWTYAGALWDANGYWGPKGQHWVYDVPFLTVGANCQWVAPAGKNGKTCDGEYFGIEGFTTDYDNASRYGFKAPLEAVRLNESNGEIGRWSVGDGNTSTALANMRHFAARNGGRYVVTFPGRPLPTFIAFDITNAYRAGDSVVVAVPFNGGVTVSGYTIAGQKDGREAPYSNSSVRAFQHVGSLAEVVSSSTGDRMWQDRANNLVWVKYQGGLALPNASSWRPLSDEDLYRTSSVVLRAQ